MEIPYCVILWVVNKNENKEPSLTWIIAYFTGQVREVLSCILGPGKIGSFVLLALRRHDTLSDNECIYLNCKAPNLIAKLRRWVNAFDLVTDPMLGFK